MQQRCSRPLRQLNAPLPLPSSTSRHLKPSSCNTITLLARLLASWQTIAVASVHTNRALCLVLEEPEVGVIGGSLAGDASASTDETWADVDGVCVAWLHVDRRERRERTWRGLVVVGGVSVGAGAWVVASPEEGPAALVLEG